MALKRRYQLLAGVEVQAGLSLGATLIDPTMARHLVIDPQLLINPQIFERANINRASISPFQPLAGITTAQLSFQCELAGTGGATVPPWGVFLRACGMEQYATSAKEIGAITGGPFFHGETVTQLTSNATGIVLHDTYSGSPILLLRNIVGTWTATTGAITGGTSLASAPGLATGLWSYGTSWAPTSDEILTFNYTSTDTGILAGHEVRGVTSGALGIITTAPTASPLTAAMRVLDGTFTAPEDLDDLTVPGLTVTAATGYSQTGFPALGMAVIEDGVAKKMKGARGTFSLAGTIGEAKLFSFQFSGIMDGNPVDLGNVVGVTYLTIVPPVMLGVTLSVGDDTDTTEVLEFSPRFQSINFDQGATVGIPRDAGEITGVYGSAHQTARASTGSMTIDVGPEAQYAFLAKMIAGASTRIREDIGTTEGNIFTISTPRVAFTGETPGESEGIGTRDMAFRIASSRHGGAEADDAELVITYAADILP